MSTETPRNSSEPTAMLVPQCSAVEHFPHHRGLVRRRGEVPICLGAEAHRVEHVKQRREALQAVESFGMGRAQGPAS